MAGGSGSAGGGKNDGRKGKVIVGKLTGRKNAGKGKHIITNNEKLATSDGRLLKEKCKICTKYPTGDLDKHLEICEQRERIKTERIKAAAAQARGGGVPNAGGAGGAAGGGAGGRAGGAAAEPYLPKEFLP